MEKSKEKPDLLELDTGDVSSDPDFQWAFASPGLFPADLSGDTAVSYHS